MEQIKSIEYQKLIEEFTFFLETTGFATSTIVMRNRNLKEFLQYLEEEGLNTLKEIKNSHLQTFMDYQHKRENRVYGSGLKTSSINQYGSLLNKLAVYLRDYKQQYQISINLPYLDPDYKERQTLTYEEIAELFAFTELKVWKMRYQDFYRQRNQAMLCIYYCCGLRKNEGVNPMSLS